MEPDRKPNWSVEIICESGMGDTEYLAVLSPFLKATAAWLCKIHVDGEDIAPVQHIDLGSGAYQICFRTRCGDFTVTIQTENEGDRFVWSVSLQGSVQQVWICFPFLQQLSVGNNTHWIDLFSLENPQKIPLLRYRNDQAPMVATDGERALVLLQEGKLLQDRYTPHSLMHSPGIEFTVTPDPTTVYCGQVVLTEGGWRKAFATVRNFLRSHLDLTEYSREDLRWYNEQLVIHFTFLYGREILDLDRNRFNVDRFLDEGERDFGGYDGFLIWGGYPRLGIDERTQWEFYDDVPGGRQALRAMSERAHARGVRFFVPYLPWDHSHEVRGCAGPPDHEELARLIGDLDADGVFLDTLDMITPEFRQSIDRLKAGVVFCSELRAQGKAVELVTGSWEQSYTRDGRQGNWSAAPEYMPMIDLWRFVLPEHRLFVINRHAMGDDRIRIIQRAFFNGMGWVIWMDVFGLTLPYTPAEAALVKKCRTIFRDNLDALNGDSPTPLIETLQPSLFTNEFAGAAQRMWTFYNAGECPVAGRLLQLTPQPDHHMVDVWHGCHAQVAPEGILTGRIEPHSVGCIVEYPICIDVDRRQMMFRLRHFVGDEVVEIGNEQCGYDTLTPSTQWMKLPCSRWPQHIRLMRGRRVIDQVYVNSED